MRVYLLDANMLITLSKGYYHPDRVPEFWTWLEEMAIQGYIRIPEEIFGEVVPTNQPRKDRDWVSQWMLDRKKLLSGAIMIDHLCQGCMIGTACRK